MQTRSTGIGGTSVPKKRAAILCQTGQRGQQTGPDAARRKDAKMQRAGRERIEGFVPCRPSRVALWQVG